MSASPLFFAACHLSPAVCCESGSLAQQFETFRPKAYGLEEANNNGPATEEAALLERVRARQTDAMADIYDRYSAVAYSVAMRVLRDPAAAEDVVQDIFIQLWRNPGAFVSSRGSLCAWLAVVARNRAIDSLRRRKPEDPVEDVVLAATNDFAAEAERDCMMVKVREILADLPAEQRRMLEMSFFEGRTHTEIAAETGDPLGTVKTRIRTALLALRRQLAA
jgi:RNA polymerase sigma-70 factor, ECF subfamily